MWRLTDGLDMTWLRVSPFDAWAVWGFWLAWVFYIGCCMGSFLHVCIWRMPRGESVVNVPSHCPKCGMPIRWYDNIPLFSYLALRGKCRGCKVPISPRYWLVELLCGVLFAGALAKVGFTGQPLATVGVYWVALSLIVTTIFIDCRYRIIPDATTYPALAAGVALSIAFPSIWGIKEYWLGGVYAVASGAACGLALWLFAVIGRAVMGKDALGMGDVKFMAAIAVLLGLPGAFFTLLAGSFLGLLYGAFLTLRRRKFRRRMAIPFGPPLALAAAVWLFAGEKLFRLYLDGAAKLAEYLSHGAPLQ